jgi:hypothetical protein
LDECWPSQSGLVDFCTSWEAAKRPQTSVLRIESMQLGWARM